MYSILMIGFETQEQAEEFMNWYSGQGEQYSDTWFQCRYEEGILHSPKNPMFNKRLKDQDTEDCLVMSVRF